MQKFFIGLALLSMPLFADDSGVDENFQDAPIEKLDLIAQAPRATKEYVPEETLGMDPQDSIPQEKAVKEYTLNDPYDEKQGPFFTGEFIYWKTHSTRMPIAAKDVIEPPLAGPPPGVGYSKKTYEARFGYDWGYRAGVGYRLPYRNWDILGNWTHFRTSAERTITPGENETVTNIWGTLNLPPDLVRSHGKQEIQLNTFDFELGKNIHFTPPFCVRPFVGFKLAWIDQSLKVDNQLPDLVPNTTRSHFHFDNDFRGVGLRLGFNTDWEIPKGFAVLGRAAYSLLWGKLKLNHTEHYDFLPPAPGAPPVAYDFNFPERRHIIQSVIELFAGVRWEKVYNHDKYRFRIQGGYEAQYWPSFNQLTRIAEVNNIHSDLVFPFTGDLGFHGWTGGVRFDF